MKRAIALIVLAAGILAADLSKPGWGQFPNPVFYTKWAANAVRDKSEEGGVNPDDIRLKNCEEVDNLETISNVQAGLRETLEGKSSVLAVQQLGTPACQLANGSFRWLTETGLSLDATVTKGEVEKVELTR